MNTKQLQLQLEAELKNILHYWIENTIDDQFGGFVGKRNGHNLRVVGASKGAVLNARILWTFSAAYNHSHKIEYLEVAHRAYYYLISNFWDHENGGLFWELNEDGTLLNGRKQIYAQGFGIFGFSEYFRATGKEAALEYAIALFDLIEKYSHDPVYGGYVEALSQDWSQLDDMRLSAKDANEPKSMNTHLHLLEPYTNLLRVMNDNELELRIEEMIRIFLDKIIDPETHHLDLFFGHDWEVRSAIFSYGHDIEAAWLLYEAAEQLGKKELIKEVETSLFRIVNAVIADGCDKDGSIFYERDLVTKHLDTDKHWWPQAEAMIGFTYAAQISGNKKYLENLTAVWRFIQDKIVDKTNGEWFWSVDQAGNPNRKEDKTGFWKCPYHNARAMMEVVRVLKLI